MIKKNVPPGWVGEKELAQAIDRLKKTVDHFPDEYPHLFRPGRELLFTYLKGIVYGLGALTAVAIVIPSASWPDSFGR